MKVLCPPPSDSRAEMKGRQTPQSKSRTPRSRRLWPSRPRPAPQGRPSGRLARRGRVWARSQRAAEQGRCRPRAVRPPPGFVGRQLPRPPPRGAKPSRLWPPASLPPAESLRDRFLPPAWMRRRRGARGGSRDQQRQPNNPAVSAGLGLSCAGRVSRRHHPTLWNQRPPSRQKATQPPRQDRRLALRRETPSFEGTSVL